MKYSQNALTVNDGIFRAYANIRRACHAHAVTGLDAYSRGRRSSGFRLALYGACAAEKQTSWDHAEIDEESNPKSSVEVNLPIPSTSRSC